jgi:hypothetical protein
MIVVSDGQFTLPEETPAAEARDRSADQAPEPAGQMFMIRKGVETLLMKGEPLPLLKPTLAWRRITDPGMGPLPLGPALVDGVIAHCTMINRDARRTRSLWRVFGGNRRIIRRLMLA